MDDALPPRSPQPVSTSTAAARTLSRSPLLVPAQSWPCPSERTRRMSLRAATLTSKRHKQHRSRCFSLDIAYRVCTWHIQSSSQPLQLPKSLVLCTVFQLLVKVETPLQTSVVWSSAYSAPDASFPLGRQLLTSNTEWPHLSNLAHWTLQLDTSIMNVQSYTTVNLKPNSCEQAP